MHLSIISLLFIVPIAIAQCVTLDSPTIQVGSLVYPVDDCFMVQPSSTCDYAGAALKYSTYLGFKAAPNQLHSQATILCSLTVSARAEARKVVMGSSLFSVVDQ